MMMIHIRVAQFLCFFLKGKLKKQNLVLLTYGNILLDVKINTGNRNNLTDYTADEERHLSLFKFHF